MQFRRVDFHQADSTQLTIDPSLLIPEAHFFLQHQALYPLIFGIEAIDKGVVVGFALGVCEMSIERGRLASLFVKEEQRRQGIGSQLLAYLEAEFVKEGCVAIYTEFSDDNPFREAVEKILSKRKWAPPTLYMLNCYYRVQEFHPPWWDRVHPLPETFQEFLWKDLKAEERKRLVHQAEQWTFHPSVSPIRQAETIEYQNSLGLRHEGKVVGWMMTHRVDADTIAYSALYIAPEYRHTGCAIRLLIDSIALQKESSVPYSLFKVNLEEVDPSWIAFVKRRLIPYACRMQRIYWSWHQLIPTI